MLPDTFDGASSARRDDGHTAAHNAHLGTTSIPATEKMCNCFVKGSKEGPEARRNLVVCIDGTANQFGRKNTNVVKLYSRLEKTDNQLTYYNSGVGTYAQEPTGVFGNLKQKIYYSLDRALAWTFKDIVLKAYQWLVEQYQDGDKIFLFGFSRGAYQIRVLAGMIEKVGLLHKGNTEQIPFAYALYLATTANRTRNDTEASISTIGTKVLLGGEEFSLSDHFKSSLSRRHVQVHFVGAWDTVSAIGFARGPSLPETATGMKHVCAFRHALALDELRVKFLPEYANGGAGPLKEGNVKEVWFAGCHSDIGGRRGGARPDQFGPSACWMMSEAEAWGLRLEEYKGKWILPCPTSSMTLRWKILEWLPIPLTRLSYDDDMPNGQECTVQWPPHMEQSRQVKEGQLIHQSVFHTMKKVEGYTPCASLQQGNGWMEVLEQQDMIETDTTTSIELILENMQQALHAKTEVSLEDIMGLKQLTIQGNYLGSFAALADVALQTLRVELGSLASQPEIMDEPASWQEARQASASRQEALIKTLAVASATPYGFRKKIFSDLQGQLSAVNCDEQEIISAKTHILGIYAYEPIIVAVLEHSTVAPNAVWSLAFSPNGQKLVAGFQQRNICLWDVASREVLHEIPEGHKLPVSAIQFSPRGDRIISGSFDATVKIWDSATGTQTMLLGRHAHQVTGVAWSLSEEWRHQVPVPDDAEKIREHHRIVSCAADGTLQSWDMMEAEGQRRKWAQQLSGPCFGVACSPDAAHIVSCSDTIQLWDAATGLPDSKWWNSQQEEKIGPFSSVAFSSNGQHIVTILGNKTIQMWKADIGQAAFAPWDAEEHDITVKFSPDNQYVAAAGSSCTIQIWDANNGRKVLGPLKGHTGIVLTIAFSPDGKFLASGGSDGLVLIWDLPNFSAASQI